MKYVDRTATQYGERGDSFVQPSRPLSAFRHEWAYVLLGDPGAGKTTAFRHEAEAEEARYVTARELVRGDLGGDLDGDPDANDAVLFIDGLDEVRAGGGDPRSPLDHIVARLRKLGSPRFRVSCRPADWGLTDASALHSLLDSRQSLLDGGQRSRDTGRLPILRLDPLGNDDIRNILDGLPAAQGIDTADFVRQAVDRGLGGLLDNPQSLSLLTRVVARGQWPASRTEVFEEACRLLVQEQNPEHIDAGRRPDASDLDSKRLLDAAGQLSAFFVLTNAQALTLEGSLPRGGSCRDLSLEEVDGDRQALSRVLATMLFTAQSPGRFAPVHLHIAEYIGARFLCNAIKGETSGQGAGPPIARVLALLAGHDGGTAAGLRGMAAWLAALCGEARHALVSADPIGVLAHGDAGGFGDDDLAHLIRALEGRARQLSRQAWSAPALGSMIRPSTIKILRAHTGDNDRSDSRQTVVDLLLRGIPHAALAPWASPERSPTEARPFIAELLRLVRNRTWRPRVREAGLAAALHAVKRSGEGDELVDELLSDVKEGRLHDPNNQLRGNLLAALYPGRVTPEQIWDYVPEKADRWLIGHDIVFWSKTIEQNASDSDLPVLLEGLHANSSRLLTVLREDQLDVLVHRMLARMLNAHGESAPVSRLSKWIETAVWNEIPDAGRRNSSVHQHVRSWFADHPAICRDCLLEFLTRNAHKEHLRLNAWRYRRKLFNESPPPGFAAWCLDHSIGLANCHAPAARLLLEWAVPLRRIEPRFDRWVASATARLQELPELRDHLASLAAPQAPGVDATEATLAKWKQEAATVRERQRQEEQQFVAYVRARADQLAAASCEPALLDCLARTYFGFDSGHMLADPVESLRSSLDSDDNLVSAALSGFKCTLERDDLPDLDEIVRLDKEGRRSLYALPVLAGLTEGDRTGYGDHRRLTEDQIRRAMGFYYVSPRPMVRSPYPLVQGPHPGWYRRAEIPQWYDELVRSHAEVVAESLVAVHISKIKRKASCEEHLAPVAHDPRYRKLAQLAAPLLLRAFPASCTRPQISALRHLLWAAVGYAVDGLSSLVENRLGRSGMDVAQRVQWLGAGMLVSPGRYLSSAMEFIGKGSTTRVRHLMDFVVPDILPSFSMEWGTDGPGRATAALDVDAGLPSFLTWSTEQLAMAVRSVGARVEPWPPGGNEPEAHLMTPADEAADKAQRLLSAWLDGLANKPGAKAADALKTLAVAPELAAWRHDVLEALDQQAVLRRAQLHRIPTASEVRQVLRDGQPTNPADLLALLVARLEQLARDIRDDNTNDWRQYWNVDSHGRPKDPRPEPTCRDALLSALRSRLPTGVGVNFDAQPEAQYAEGKRSDIRVACNGHAVPVEIKKNTHPQLWSAVYDQLIAKYARARESGGFGVYLVLWFGASRTKTVPPTGRRPRTPGELRQRLESQVPPSKRHKIKVVVVDVSPPGDRSA